jgi:adenosylmethionine-8-amino-7-oxononanoate aminotransferase
VILDEVMCGMGRMGMRCACNQERITADMIALGKGLSAGYLPLGAAPRGRAHPWHDGRGQRCGDAQSRV